MKQRITLRTRSYEWGTCILFLVLGIVRIIFSGNDSHRLLGLIDQSIAMGVLFILFALLSFHRKLIIIDETGIQTEVRLFRYHDVSENHLRLADRWGSYECELCALNPSKVEEITRLIGQRRTPVGKDQNSP